MKKIRNIKINLTKLVEERTKDIDFSIEQDKLKGIDTNSREYRQHIKKIIKVIDDNDFKTLSAKALIRESLMIRGATLLYIDSFQTEYYMLPINESNMDIILYIYNSNYQELSYIVLGPSISNVIRKFANGKRIKVITTDKKLKDKYKTLNKLFGYKTYKIEETHLKKINAKKEHLFSTHIIGYNIYDDMLHWFSTLIFAKKNTPATPVKIKIPLALAKKIDEHFTKLEQEVEGGEKDE